MAPDSPLTPQHRIKRVSIQHTQERVRNNQRRHRARRKEYIVSLEGKLREAELTISTLRDQAGALQAALRQLHRQTQDQDEADCRIGLPLQTQSSDGTSPPPLKADGDVVEAYDALSDTDVRGTWNQALRATTEPFVSNEISGLRMDSLIFPHDETSHALMLTAQSGSAKDPQVADSGSVPAKTITQSHILTPTTPCCYEDSSTDLQPTAQTTSRRIDFGSQETSPLIPESVLQSALDTYYKMWPYEESTIACSQAYLLIAQQNFKGMNQGDVTTWLWSGFRKSVQPGEGCRVQTDILFSLLAFINDTSSDLLTDVSPQH